MKSTGKRNLLQLTRFWLAALCALVPLLLSGPSAAMEVSAQGFKAFLAAFRATAVESGIRPEVYDRVTASLTPDFSLPDLDIPSRSGKGPGQPEFVRTPEQYLNAKYMSDLAAQGKRFTPLTAMCWRDRSHLRHRPLYPACAVGPGNGIRHLERLHA